MVKFLNTLILITFLFSGFSCQQTAKLLYGVQKPGIKSEDEILSYALKLGLDTSAIYALDYSAYIDRFLKYDAGIVHLELFNKQGQLIVPTDSLISKCSGRISGYISHLHDSTQYETNDSVRIWDYLKGMTHLDGKKAEFQISQSYDFTAVINWASFMGKLNESVVEWSTQLNQKEDISVRIIYINLDYNNFWGPNKLTN